MAVAQSERRLSRHSLGGDGLGSPGSVGPEPPQVVGSGACILNFGDHNDQIGEIGRSVVDPAVGGKGLGKRLVAALVDASDERVEFGFAEARTVHPKSQKIFDDVELSPIGFLPMFYGMSWRESFVLNGQLFGNGRHLRRAGSAEVILVVEPLARLSLRNLELDEPVTVRDDARGYPLDQYCSVDRTPRPPWPRRISDF